MFNRASEWQIFVFNFTPFASVFFYKLENNAVLRSRPTLAYQASGILIFDADGFGWETMI